MQDMTKYGFIFTLQNLFSNIGSWFLIHHSIVMLPQIKVKFT